MHKYFDLTMCQEFQNSTTKPPQKIDLFKCVSQYRKYTQNTTQHVKYQKQLKDFMIHEKHKVLFIFGPTGCGKHMLINNFLTKHKIAYQWRAQQILCYQNQTEFTNYLNQWQCQTKVKRVIDQLYQSLSNQTNDVKFVQIYEDFPIINTQTTYKQLQQIKKFRLSFFKQIHYSKAKIIFILNSDIYNPFYIMRQASSESIKQIILKGYSVTDIKNICDNFCNEFPQFKKISSNSNFLDQIVQISNGDARKMLLNLYKFYIDKQRSSQMKKMSKIQIKQHKFKAKNQQKFSLFHLIGKYMHAKRYDIHKKQDRKFTRQQLKNFDPPFYFNPVNTFLKSGVLLSTFADLLFQNYLDTIATIEDAKNISSLFSHLDSSFPEFITNKRVDSLSQQSQVQYIFQLTWGIILLNKSSNQARKIFTSFRKSQSNHVMRQRQQKRYILRVYFPFWTLSSLAKFGQIVKNSKTSKQFLIKSIIKKRYKKYISFKKETQNKIISQVEQQQFEEKGEDVKDFIALYKQKKDKALFMQQTMRDLQKENDVDYDDSDIQQQVQQQI